MWHKLFFFALISLLAGCTSLVLEDSSPSKVVIRGHFSNPMSSAYSEAQNYCKNYGSNAVFKKKIDGEAYRISQGCKRWCGSEYDFYEFSCEKTPPAKSVEITQPSKLVAPSVNSSASLESAKQKCADLGFKATTEEFGKCVLQLSR